MRRTAAILLFLAALAIDLPGPEESLATRALGRSANPLTVGFALCLLPYALLLASCAGRSGLHRALQAVATAGLGVLLIRRVAAADFSALSAIASFTPAGLAILSGLELRRPSADPERRFALGLLLTLAAIQSGLLAINLVNFPARSMILGWVVRPLGLAAAYLVVAWGLRVRRRWGPWVGLALSGWQLFLVLWSLAKGLGSGFFADHPLILNGLLPALVALSALAVLLSRIAWRESWRREDALTRMEPS